MGIPHSCCGERREGRDEVRREGRKEGALKREIMRKEWDGG